jgi:hypothetical protein
VTTSTYRCAGCHHYKHRPEYRRLGLGSVCSDECLHRAARKPDRDIPGKDIPAKVTRRPDITSADRRTVRARDGERCRLCGIRQDLQVHHIAYRSEGGTHDERNLITLCGEHHALVHSDKRRWQPVLFAYIRAFYGQSRRPSLLLLDRQMNATAQPVALVD